MSAPPPDPHGVSRRHFLHDCRVGLGAMALGGLLRKDASGTQQTASLATRRPHFSPRAKSVIFLFMAGGPSQLDLFQFKPKLQQFHDQVIPPSLVEGSRFSFIGKDAKLLGSKRKFARYGERGQTVSECLPHTASIVDEIAPHQRQIQVGIHAPGEPHVEFGIGIDIRGFEFVDESNVTSANSTDRVG